jgi:hypothetical protein
MVMMSTAVRHAYFCTVGSYASAGLGGRLCVGNRFIPPYLHPP